MKAFDRYSIRGIVFSALGTAGIVSELLFRGPKEVFVLILYGFVVLMGLWLLFFKEDHKT